MSATSKFATRKQAPPSVQLSELDWAILNQLSLDPLASNRTVAEALGVSTSQVATRMRWLDQKNVSRVIAVLDLKAAGQTFCFVRIDVRGRPLEEVAEEIARIRETLTVSALGGGTHDLLVLLRFSTADSLNTLLFHGLSRIEGVYRIVVSSVVDVPVFRGPYVTYMPHFLPLDVEANIQQLATEYPESVIDSVDRCIIAELQQDGRKSINDIARRYDLNSSTIRYRVKNLESKGLIHFMTVFDPGAMGVGTLALLEIEVEANHTEKVVRHLDEQGFLHQVFLCAGSAAIMAIIESDAVETIQHIKNESMSAIEGIIDVKITLITHTYKMDLRWGQQFTPRVNT